MTLAEDAGLPITFYGSDREEISMVSDYRAVEHSGVVDSIRNWRDAKKGEKIGGATFRHPRKE
jgi:hypothetical protein